MSLRSGKARRSRSASPDYDEDAEFLEAIRRSKELTSGPGLSEEDAFDQDVDLKLALQLQLAEECDARAFREDTHPLRNTIGFLNDPSHQGGSASKRDGKEDFSAYHAEGDHNADLHTLTLFMRHIKSAECPNCGSAFIESVHDARKLWLDWKSGDLPLTSLLTCTHCLTSSCPACTSQSPTKWSRVRASGKEVAWCCAGGRLLLLWLLLLEVDDHFSTVKTDEAARQRMKSQPRQEKKKKRMRGIPGGIGFGGSSKSDMPSGMGYGGYEFDPEGGEDSKWPGVEHTLSGHRFNANASNTSGKAKAMSAQLAEDEFYGLRMRLIEALLPSFERESSFDFDPPDTVAEMLMESKLLAYCAELLRNDSLEDATKRRCLYQPLLGLIRTLGAHYVSASCAIYNERPTREDRVNLVTLSFYEHPGISTEMAPSLLKGLSNLNTQSEMVLKAAKRNGNDFLNMNGEELLLLCGQIADLHQYLTTNSGKVAKVKAEEQSKAEVPALVDVPDDGILKVHHFSQAAKNTSTYRPGRSRRLVTELTNLKTGLPPGIFVRYAESRPDVQKVIIIGPVSTPYENGIFEFDLFCDSEFPNKPPKVQFRTTGGGRVSFNPNLYPDGKVCLSLLGTWSGQPWVPNESTLLQVYLSIQAMILVEEPWYNEPGREAAYHNKSGDSPSERFNHHIREHTVHTAMLEYLDKIPALWKDVLDQHFTANADKILHAAVEWSKSAIKNPPRGSGFYDYDGPLDDDFEAAVPLAEQSRRSGPAGIDIMLPQLQKALNKYGASQIVSEKLEIAVDKGKAPTPEGSGTGQAHNQAAAPDSYSSSIPPPPPTWKPTPSYMSISDFSFYSGPYPGNSAFPTNGSYFGGWNRSGETWGGDYSNAFAGPGRTLGETPQAPTALGTPDSSSGGRGGASTGVPGASRGTGRYDTRSSTRGRGGATVAESLSRGESGPATGPSQASVPGAYTTSPPHGLGGYLPDPGRGGRGGQGGRGGRDGRGGRGGRGRGGTGGRGGYEWYGGSGHPDVP